MKRVLIIIPDISLAGGTEKVASFIANSLVTLNLNVTILNLSSNCSPFYRVSSQVKIDSYENKKFFLFSYFKKNYFDIVIPISMGRLSVEISFLFKLCSISSTLILSEHVSYESFSKPVKILKKFAYSFSDHVVLLTQHDQLLLKKKTNCKTSVIPNASRFIPIENVNCKPSSKIVLAVGRMTYQKGFDRLLHLWSKTSSKENWKLRLIGEGEDKKALISLAIMLKIEDSVEFLPVTTNIDKEYLNAELLVMTSRYEGLPLAIVEAKSFGTPCIAYNCKTGPQELIENQASGVLIENGNQSKFIYHLERLLNDENHLTNLQKGALNSASNFTEEKIASYWSDLINAY